MDYLLDTNIIITYSRGNDISRKIEQTLKLFSAENRLMVSVVTLGEIESILLKSKVGQRRAKTISKLLSGMAILDINVDSIIQNYGRIEAFSQGKLTDQVSTFSSRNMGKNDLWIAATAVTFGLTLVSMDKDFDHLAGEFLDLKYVSIEEYK